MKSIATALMAVISLFSSASVLAVDVGLMFIYGNHAEKQWGSSGVITRINQWTAYSNQVFKNSGVDVNLKVVHAEKRHLGTDDSDTALESIARNENVFQGIENLRTEKGADIVLYMEDIKDACGIAYLTNGPRWAYSVVYSEKFNWYELKTCDDSTLPHEIGHIFGLGHGNLQGSPGLAQYAGGHGKGTWFGGGWSTTMMYPSKVGVFAKRVDQFSDPNLNKCKGDPCGIASGNLAADSVRWLHSVKANVAAYR